MSGSGMHFNMSLFNKDGNVLYDEENELGLGKTAYHFLAGILDHALGYTAICNPTVNSYKRLIPGYEAPVYIAWSARNRSPLVRIPSSRGISTRIELRSVDPSANPYLAVAVLLQSGLDGVKRELIVPNAIDRNIYRMSSDERYKKGIKDLPSTLHNAVKYLQQDKVVQDALGNHIYKSFVSAKQIEWAAYREQVSEWEKEKYLTLY